MVGFISLVLVMHSISTHENCRFTNRNVLVGPEISYLQEFTVVYIVPFHLNTVVWVIPWLMGNCPTEYSAQQNWEVLAEHPKFWSPQFSSVDAYLRFSLTRIINRDW